MKVITLHRFEQVAEMQKACQLAIENQLRLALAEREGALMVLAGGRTPQPIYQALALVPLEWSNVLAVPSDERWVEDEHPNSNFRMLQSCFDGCDIQLESLLPKPLPSLVSAHHATRVMAACPQDFDLVLLGMGGDGHFASLFPNAPEALFRGDRLEAAVCLKPDPLPPEAPHERISLSLSRLLRARLHLLCINGESKLALLNQSQERTKKLPIDHLLAALAERNKQLHVYWSP